MKLQRCNIGFCPRITVILLVVTAVETVMFAQKMPDRSIVEPTHNQDIALVYLRPVLAAVGAGRIYFSTVCYDKGEPVPFPLLNVQQIPKGLTGLTAIREVYKKDKRVTVTQSQSGMVRIVVGSPETALLQTRIHLANLSWRAQYDASTAILAIEMSKELDMARRELKMREPLTVTHMAIPLEKPSKDLPHLSSSAFEDTTLDQALDLIAKTFSVIVLYGTCIDTDGSHLFRLDVAGMDAR